MTAQATPFTPSYFHGTKADLRIGDTIEAGFNSNYGNRNQAAFAYVSATLDAAIWGAELAVGDGPGRIYVVEPTGTLEDDPNLTNQRFPGNPSKSYRTRDALRILAEVTHWQGHPPEQVKTMLEHIAELERQGITAIED